MGARLLLVLAVAAALPGAAPVAAEPADLRVAVLPFAGRNAPAGAWSRLRDPLARELAAAGFRVVDPQAVETVLRRMRLRDPSLMESFEASGLAAALGADRLLIGAIDLCRAEPAPAVSLAGRLLDPRGLRVTAITYTVVDDRALLKPLGIGGPVTLERTLAEAARRFAAGLAAPPRGGSRSPLLRTSVLAPDPAAALSQRLERGTVRRIVVLPFRNRTARPGAGQAAADAAAWVLSRGAGVDLVDAGDATRRLLRRGWRTGLPVGREEILALGRETGVDAVLMGDVDIFEEGLPSAGGAPKVALSVRLLDAAGGGILWAAQHERRGDETRILYEAGNVRLAEDLLARALNEILHPLFEILATDRSGGGTDR